MISALGAFQLRSYTIFELAQNADFASISHLVALCKSEVEKATAFARVSIVRRAQMTR
jgi:hypothetical protein